MDKRYLPLIFEMLDVIEKNIKNKQLSDARYSEICSENHWFPVVFSVAIGQTYEQYSLARTISDSALLLLSTNRTITDIAHEYNFGSQQTYSTLFTGVVGVPPHVFRAERSIDKLTERIVPDDRLFMGMSTEGVQVVELPPMTVASVYLHKSNSRQSKIKISREILEPKAWSKLIKWQMSYAYYNYLKYEGKNPGIAKLSRIMVEGCYHMPPYSRFFGFLTTFNTVDVGYEAWSMMKDDRHDVVSDDKDVVIKHFPGGTYAVIDVPKNNKEDVVTLWKSLHKWILENKDYTYGEHQYLEEYITVPKMGGFHGKKLYMPIKKVDD